MSSYISFIYEFSNCGICCLFKDENAPAVFFFKKVFGSCIIFIYFVFFSSPLEKQKRETKHRNKAVCHTVNLWNINNKLYLLGNSPWYSRLSYFQQLSLKTVLPKYKESVLILLNWKKHHTCINRHSRLKACQKYFECIWKSKSISSKYLKTNLILYSG